MTREEAIKAFRGLSGVLLPREYYREAIQIAISALQQPEIIHCRDCKYNTTSKKCLHPDSIILIPAEDDFCSYAERRDDPEEQTRVYWCENERYEIPEEKS